MSKSTFDAPPSYMEAMQTTVITQPPVQGYGGGIIEQTTTIPVVGYSSGYPVSIGQPPIGTMAPGQQPIPPYPINPTAPPPPGFMPTSYGTIGTTTTTTSVVVPKEIIVIGGCPACRLGKLEDDYTCCGICCAIFLFPIGILCCLCMKEKRCNKCGATF